MVQLHANCVRIGAHAVLLRGPSGAGKSALSLRLITAGGFLVSDDRTDLVARDGRLIASAPIRLPDCAKCAASGWCVACLLHPRAMFVS